MKVMTADEVLYKLAARCSVSEQCLSDIETKLAKYDLTEEEKTRIVRHLVEEKYVDDRRYAEAFVRDKYRFNKWGRIKIAQGLRMKGIDKETIDTAMEAIDEQEYIEILRDLIKSKDAARRERTTTRYTASSSDSLRGEDLNLRRYGSAWAVRWRNG